MEFLYQIWRRKELSNLEKKRGGKKGGLKEDSACPASERGKDANAAAGPVSGLDQNNPVHPPLLKEKREGGIKGRKSKSLGGEKKKRKATHIDQ